MKRAGLAALVLSLASAVAVVPAMANTLYSNLGPGSYQTSAWNFVYGPGIYTVTDSFTLSQNSTVTGATFAVWEDQGEPLTSVQWAITSTPFGTPISSGSQSNPDTGLIVNVGFDIDGEAVSIPDVSLSAGTYWFQLVSGTGNSYPAYYWDESDGSSTAYENNYGQIPSETFEINGTTGSAVTPEPSSFLLLGSGLVGLAGMIRRKIRI